MNPQEKAEMMKARLADVQREQAAIATTAIEAVEKGTDPELAVQLAEAAASEIPSVSELSNRLSKVAQHMIPATVSDYNAISTNRLDYVPEVPAENRLPHVVDSPFSEGVKIWRRNPNGPAFFSMTHPNGTRGTVAFDANGIGFAPEEFATLLIRGGMCVRVKETP
jgi:hypothetical protein